LKGAVLYTIIDLPSYMYLNIRIVTTTAIYLDF